MPRSDARRARSTLPTFIKPQLSRLVGEAPEGPDWLHEIKYDGYRMHARLDAGDVRLLTRTGLDWTHKSRPIAKEARPARVAGHAVTSPSNAVLFVPNAPAGPCSHERHSAIPILLTQSRDCFSDFSAACCPRPVRVFQHARRVFRRSQVGCGHV